MLAGPNTAAGLQLAQQQATEVRQLRERVTRLERNATGGAGAWFTRASKATEAGYNLPGTAVYVLRGGGTLVAASSSLAYSSAIPVESADVGGVGAASVRVRVVAAVNAVSAGVTTTVGLARITGVSGGAVTLDSPLVTVTSPSLTADSLFDMTTNTANVVDGNYAVTLQASGAYAASSFVAWAFDLQLRRSV